MKYIDYIQVPPKTKIGWDTGYMLNSIDDEVYLDFMPISGGGTDDVWYCYVGDWENNIYIRSQGNRPFQLMGVSFGDYRDYIDEENTVLANFNERSEMHLSKSIFENLTSGTSIALNATRLYDEWWQQINITISCERIENGDPIRCIPAKYYGFKVVNGNTTKLDLKPVLDDNNVPCFYDEVGGNFIYHSGSGTPIAGPLSSTIFVSGQSSVSSVGGNVELTVDSKTSWTASTTANWFTISTTAGTSATTSTTITVSENQSNSGRSDVINFVNETGDTDTFVVYQKKVINQVTFCERVSNNGTSAIDTGVYPDSATTIDIFINNENTGNTGYESVYVGNSGLKLTTYNSIADAANYAYGDGGIIDFSFPTGTTIEFNLSNTGITMSNGMTGSISVSEFTATGDTIKIGGNGCSASFGRCVISKDGDVVKDLKPCIVGNMTGFYDSVSGEFYSGSTFTPINAYGNIILGDGDNDVEGMNIGSEGVKMVYIGDKPIYANTPVIV